MAKPSSKRKVAKKAKAKKPRRPPPAEKPPRTKSAIGRQARNFGHTFERMVVNLFKETFAEESWAEFVRRADQSHKAFLPDVTGVPGLWPELQAAAQTTPLAKLAQAIRDTQPYREQDKEVIPLAVTRSKGAKRDSIKVTMRLQDAAFLLAEAAKRTHAAQDTVASMTLDAFIVLYQSARLWENKDWAPFAIDTAKLSQQAEEQRMCGVQACTLPAERERPFCALHAQPRLVMTKDDDAIPGVCESTAEGIGEPEKPARKPKRAPRGGVNS